MDKMTATPVEFDTALADLHGSLRSIGNKLDSAWYGVHSSVGDQRDYRTRNADWKMSNEDARVAAVALKNNPETPAWKVQHVADALRELGEARMALADAHEEIREFGAAFKARGGWTRVFLVTNGNGHAHSSMNCSTCYPTTQYHWVTELSAAPESEIVEAAADRACTVCYPTAPVEKKSTLFTPDEIDKAKAKVERENAKAKREADRAAKAPTKDGQPLTVEYTWDRGDRVFNYSETFKTERAAIIWATDQMAWVTDASDNKWNAVNVIIEAIATKRGTDTRTILDEFMKKAAKKKG
jgi:hypothetical protein